MTLSVAWIRRVGDVEELVFASDSRLRGGEAWDCCPKIIPMPRSDCLVAFSGSTWRAYPLALQLANAIELFPGSRRRRKDISDLRTHSLQVFEQMMSLLHDLPAGQTSPETPDTEFLIGGFSWKRGEYRIWRLHFDAHLGRYTFAPIREWPGQAEGARKVVAFSGDVAQEAAERLRALLQKRGKLGMGGLDMEPFEVLRDMIRSEDFPSVGGAPQLAKVYRYLQVQPFGVMWPDSSGTPHAYGRPALSYEIFDAPVMDPDAPAEHHRPRLRRSRRHAETSPSAGADPYEIDWEQEEEDDWGLDDH